MRYLFATAVASAVALAVAGPACAQGVEVTPLVDARLRYEHVDQDGLPRDADAVTVRIRAGVQAAVGPWSALVEAQGNLAIVDHYYDGLHGAATRPLVADPENIALYRAQLQYRTKTLTLTAGRQRIALDDERFVAAAPFRQNGQTFDAVRAEVTAVPKLKLDVTYAWRVRTIWGIDGFGARPQAIDGDTVLTNLSYRTPVGTLVGFAYLVDQDEARVQAFRLSSQTYGARLAGSRPLSKVARLSYQLSYARQEDWHRNPNDYRASYFLADATLGVKGWTLNGGYEVLGADRGVALASFQTPLGSLFRFHGWADRFTITPPNGLRDLYAGGGYGWKKVLGADAITLSGAYHRFRSDRLAQEYGDLFNLLAAVKVKRTTVSARYAHYKADTFATDTDKLWLQLDWSY